MEPIKEEQDVSSPPSPLPAVVPLQICRSYAKHGRCTLPACIYDHPPLSVVGGSHATSPQSPASESVLAPTQAWEAAGKYFEPQAVSTPDCLSWVQTGTCPYGIHCQFAHSPHTAPYGKAFPHPQNTQNKLSKQPTPHQLAPSHQLQQPHQQVPQPSHPIQNATNPQPHQVQPPHPQNQAQHKVHFKENGKPKVLCKNWNKDCKFGESCRFYHPKDPFDEVFGEGDKHNEFDSAPQNSLPLQHQMPMQSPQAQISQLQHIVHIQQQHLHPVHPQQPFQSHPQYQQFSQFVQAPQYQYQSIYSLQAQPPPLPLQQGPPQLIPSQHDIYTQQQEQIQQLQQQIIQHQIQQQQIQHQLQLQQQQLQQQLQFQLQQLPDHLQQLQLNKLADPLTQLPFQVPLQLQAPTMPMPPNQLQVLPPPLDAQQSLGTASQPEQSLAHSDLPQHPQSQPTQSSEQFEASESQSSQPTQVVQSTESTQSSAQENHSQEPEQSPRTQTQARKQKFKSKQKHNQTQRTADQSTHQRQQHADKSDSKADVILERKHDSLPPQQTTPTTESTVQDTQATSESGSSYKKKERKFNKQDRKGKDAIPARVGDHDSTVSHKPELEQPAPSMNNTQPHYNRKPYNKSQYKVRNTTANTNENSVAQAVIPPTPAPANESTPTPQSATAPSPPSTHTSNSTPTEKYKKFVKKDYHYNKGNNYNHYRPNSKLYKQSTKTYVPVKTNQTEEQTNTN